MRVSSTLRLFDLGTNASGILDRPVKPGDDGWIHLRIPAARGVRVVQESSAQKEGAGKAGCPPHPQPRVQSKTKHTSVVTTGSPVSLGLPRAMVLTAYIALSPVTGLSCHRRPRKLPSANLTPASGRQDHTTSPSAPATLVLRRCRVHRIPHPTFVTIAKRPSDRGGMGRVVNLICPTGKGKYFCKED
jgi:hypothetical protein